ncbi:EMILIN-1-like [Pomacea canaliculata]|uniref:EMILIN-1-like n=1 Tax=Pomacea canaliculata TaxID=400727 RepID=UPI000D72D1E8|nr:EMILIN-1-like [Pomacea canaliculata]
MTMATLSTLLLALTLMVYANAEVGVYQEIIEINARLDRLERHVFFMATTSLTTLPSGALVFGEIRANTGGAYNPATGVFTAPVAGLYLFTVQTYIRVSGRAKLELRVNGSWILRAKTGYGDDESNQFVYPLYLNSGDKVNVENTYPPFTIWAEHHTFFSGLLFRAL